jgi:hypothetical protein
MTLTSEQVAARPARFRDRMEEGELAIGRVITLPSVSERLKCVDSARSLR